MNTDETGENRKYGDVRRSFLVTLERKVTVRQYQVVEIEVEAGDKHQAGREAILAADSDEIDHDDWQVVDGGNPWRSISLPSVGSVEAVSNRQDVVPISGTTSGSIHLIVVSQSAHPLALGVGDPAGHVPPPRSTSTSGRQERCR